MIKRILVALDPSPYSEAATEWACFLAKRHKAEVTGLVVLDLPGIMESVGPVPLGGQYYSGILQYAREEEALEHIKSLLTGFAARCDRHGVTHSECQLQGSPSEKIV